MELPVKLPVELPAAAELSYVTIQIINAKQQRQSVVRTVT